jgi:hypothetical protein
MGGAGGVEADETYSGKKEVQPTVRKDGMPHKRAKGKFGSAGKRPIVALVERGGSVRTFHVDVANKVTVAKIVEDDVARETKLYTDESGLYPEVG